MKFVLSRLLLTAGVVLGVVSLVFMLLHLVPGDPVEAMLGESARPADRTALREALGLNRPLPVQYIDYLDGLTRLDLGDSISRHRPVAALIAERLPATLALTGCALVVAVSIAFPLGLFAARWRGGFVDRGASVLAVAGTAIPNFALGPLLVLAFSIGLGWFPVSGWESPEAIVLPSITLGSGLAAVLARLLRSSMLESINEDFMRTARAKGLGSWGAMVKHGLRHALLPVVTVLGVQLGALLAGAVVTETVFDWPGLGRLTIEAIESRDYPLVQGCVLVISLFYVVVNRVTDLGYALIDPRIRRAAT